MLTWVDRCAGHLKLELCWLLFCIQFEQIIALQSDYTQKKQKKRVGGGGREREPQPAFWSIIQNPVNYAPREVWQTGQIVLKLLDCWVNATRNDLLFIFILDDYMSFLENFRVKVE